MISEQLHVMLSAAVLAPSVHNTQPWHFSVDVDGALQVHADRSRQLAAQDPDGRELALSCGAAAGHARTALRGLGIAGHVSVNPSSYDKDLLARVHVGGPQPASPEELLRAAALPLRHTDRTAFSPEPVEGSVLAALRGVAQADGVWVRYLDGDDAVELAVLLAAADSLQHRDDGVQAELRRWTREEPGAADGVPVGGPVPQRVARGSDVVIRDFTAGREVPVASFDPPAHDRPVLVVMGTDGDTQADWVRAGVALSDVLLSATGRGLVASPLTQVLEVPATRNRLATALGVLGRPQMVLRMGYPSGIGSPITGRRPAEAVLRDRRLTVA
jgi:hypothetical protein